MMKYYTALFNFVAEKRLKAQDIDPRKIHASLVMTITTGGLMWAYAFVAYFTISSPIPGIVGFVASFTHFLAPFLFRFTGSSFLVVSVGLGGGIAHQGTYAYYTGGFDSHVLIWFGILPMLGAIVSGRLAATVWFVITNIWAGVYLILHLSGYQFPNLITPTGHIITQFLLVFGYIFLTTSITYVFLFLNERREELLNEQSEKIDGLFRVLFHDLASPLGRLSLGLGLVKKDPSPETIQEGLAISQRAVDSMLEITQNVRKIYAVKKGKVDIELSLCPLTEAVDYVRDLYASELEKKNITLDFHTAEAVKPMVLVEPVSFKNQVLGNILSNAIKFSPSSSKITINVLSETNDYLVLEIVDHGIGMPQALIKDLFNIKKKTNRPGTNGEAGTGFGLHIMKSFVEMYYGKVEVESKENHGTTIRLFLKNRLN